MAPKTSPRPSKNRSKNTPNKEDEHSQEMTPKMDLKWSPKGALKLGGIVLFTIPKRSHKTALIFSPFWTPPGPKMEPNGSQSDSKTSQSSTSKRSQKRKHNNIQQTSTTPAPGGSKALRRKKSVRASVYTSSLPRVGGLCKTPTSADFQFFPTALEILKHFGRRTQGTRQKQFVYLSLIFGRRQTNNKLLKYLRIGKQGQQT